MRNYILSLLFIPLTTLVCNRPPAGDAPKIGVNCFTWSPLDKLDTFAQVRAYISTGFIWTANGLAVEPIHQSRTDDGRGLDTWLSECKRRGILPTLCINQSPDFMGFKSPDHPPVYNDAYRTQPGAYRYFADIMGQIAKRYGKKKFPDNTLEVDTNPRWTNDPPNQRLSGLNLPFILEFWNEADKWWRRGDGSGIYMFPAECAAMVSICLDSVRAQDPDRLVAMGGITGFDINYLLGMDSAFVRIRPDHKWPAGLIVNVHHYSNSGNQLGQWPPTWYNFGAVPVTLDKDFPQASGVVKFARDRGLKVWCSEFGYDTRGPSWQAITAIPDKTAEELQGAWLKQACKAYLALGFDAVFMFEIADEPGAPNGGLYQNSGLLYGEGEPNRKWQPKPAYDSILTILKR